MNVAHLLGALLRQHAVTIAEIEDLARQLAAFQARCEHMPPDCDASR
jgi:hypothetical protein